MPPSRTTGTGLTLGDPVPAKPAVGEPGLGEAGLGEAGSLPQRVRLNPPPYRFTLHVDFTAIDPDLAGAVAATLVLGLGTLCPHVEMDSALVSPVNVPGDSTPVFCGAPGPGGASCEDLYGHPGLHAEAGVNGLRWERTLA
ncbi:MAG TPA: hypothetical protein VFR67_22420 [Pilimelia sp.]|nr:hypothetical protein [Pilimelia sp.]